MGERRSSVDKKNHSRVSADQLSGVSSIQKKSYGKQTGKKIEVTCIRCRIVRNWSQAQFNRHMAKVHGITTNVQIGEEGSLGI